MNGPQRRARRLFGRGGHGRPAGASTSPFDPTSPPAATPNGSPEAENGAATEDTAVVTEAAATEAAPVSAPDEAAPVSPPDEDAPVSPPDAAEHVAPPNPLEAMRRFWALIAILTLAGIGAGVAFGLARDPVHTAESRLSVGRVDVATQSISGWADASQILADSYSRAIVADRVIRSVRRRTGVSTQHYFDHVSSSPIPESGVIIVEATGDTRDQAMALANESARALTVYVRNLNRANPESQRLLAQYRDASQEYGRTVAERARLGGDESAAIVRAEARLQQARLRLVTIEHLYRTSQVGQASPNSLQVLAYAATTETDRDSVLQRVTFGGAVAGFLLGALLALGLARAGARRARRRAATA